MINKAEIALRRWRRNSLAREVTYSQGNPANRVLGSGRYGCEITTIEGLRATQAETRVDSDNGEVVVRSSAVDFLVDVADMVADEVAITPKAGDQISFDGLRFEVMSLGGGPCYRVHGRDHQSYRIHTKRISTDQKRWG